MQKATSSFWHAQSGRSRRASLVFDFALVLIMLFAGGNSAFAQRNAMEIKPMPMKLPAVDTNAAGWHSIRVTPRPGLPEIHFYNKINPVWWFRNADDPVPPVWYLPDDKHRAAKWRMRNPFHNFNFYVIGIADKKFVRSGYHPEQNSDPNGGWDFAVSRRMAVLLPFVSYERSWITFYFGWREHGAFGAKINFHGSPEPKEPESKPGKTEQ